MPLSFVCKFVIGIGVGIGSIGVLFSFVFPGPSLAALKIPSAGVRKLRMESCETPAFGGSFYLRSFFFVILSYRKRNRNKKKKELKIRNNKVLFM